MKTICEPMSKRHPETGLLRTQLYLTQESRDVLDLDCQWLARDDRGRAVRKLTDRVDQILCSYRDVVAAHVPTLTLWKWGDVMAALHACEHDPERFARQSIEEAQRQADQPDRSAETVKLRALAIRDVYARVMSFDPDLPFDMRLKAAGAKFAK